MLQEKSTEICKKCGVIHKPENLIIEIVSLPNKGYHKKVSCPSCKNFIKFLPHTAPILRFGKYKGKAISEVAQKDAPYLKWLLDQSVGTARLRTAIRGALTCKTTEVNCYKNVQDVTGQPVTLAKILEGIKAGNGGKWIPAIEKLRGTQDESEQKECKSSLPCFTASGLFTKRSAEGLAVHSGFILLDIDYKDNPALSEQGDRIRQRLTKDKLTAFLFASCRGKGLAVGVKIDKNHHAESFQHLEAYYKKTYGLVVDKSCKDVSRLRFVSYDPDIYINENSETFIVPETVPEQEQPPCIPHARDDDHRIMQAIIATGKPLAGIDDYDSWLNVGFAIANTFGEAGREYFHMLSGASSKYDKADCDEKYDNCLRTNKGAFTFGTIIHRAKDAGIDLMKSGSNALFFKISNIQDMLQCERPKYLVETLIYQNTVNLGKSVVSFSIAEAVSNGNKLWGRFPALKRGKVLVIDEENPGSIHRSRIEKMGVDKDTPIHFIHYQGVKLDNPKHLKALIDLINKEEYVLVIFDALIRLHNAKENDADEMAKVMQAFREIIKQTDATVLIIHHERKSRDGDKRERSRGSGDIVGAVDCQFVLEEGEMMDDGKILTLHPGKMRLASFAPIRLLFNSDTLKISYVSGVLGEGKGLIESITQFIGTGVKDFEEIQKALGVPEKQLRSALKNALGKELILDSTLKDDPGYQGSKRKQFFKLHPGSANSYLAMFPPIGGETCQIEGMLPHELIHAGNMETRVFTECGDVSTCGLPHSQIEKKYVSSMQKNEGVCQIENRPKPTPKNEIPMGNVENLDIKNSEVFEVEFAEEVANV
ncbi:MAG: hypothetical protein EDM70_12655 [Candidatus Brocadia sp. AMX2]|nr:MAG: hypothetical protein EDM70_12655 [Candidatus Brocadia sp. AMX2]